MTNVMTEGVPGPDTYDHNFCSNNGLLMFRVITGGVTMSCTNTHRHELSEERQAKREALDLRRRLRVVRLSPVHEHATRQHAYRMPHENMSSHVSTV